MCFSLILAILISTIISEVNCDCTEGFMDYDLLEQKASQIGAADGAATLSTNTLSMNTETYYVMPSLQFSCSGTISGFLVGVNAKIASQNRDMFPNVTLYSFKSSKGQESTYSRVLGSSRMIQLEENVFSSSGVYEYQLSNHLNFNKDDILGIYQPPSDQSVVELFYQPRPDEDIHTVSNGNEVKIQTKANDNNRKENRRVLLHPITSDWNCTSGFIPFDEIRTEAKKITVVKDEYYRTENLYKDIKFTCEGYITHVIIGTMNLSSNFNPPEIRLWRRNVDNTLYERSGQNISLPYDNATQDVSTPYLRWYNLSSQISVQKGDFLGIYNYLPKGEADCHIYYQKYNGPKNYYPNSSETGNNHYPLLSVVFVTGTLTIESPTSIVSTMTSEILLSSFTSGLITDTLTIGSPTSVIAAMSSEILLPSFTSVLSTHFTESENLASSSQTMFSSTPSHSELPSSTSTSKDFTESENLASSSQTMFSSTPSHSELPSSMGTSKDSSSSRQYDTNGTVLSNVNTASASGTIGIPRSTPKTTSNPELSFSTSTSKNSTSRSQYRTVTTAVSIESSTLTFDISDSGGQLSGAIAGSIFSVLFILVLVAAVIVAFSFLLWRRRNGKSKTLNLLNVNNSDGGFTNLVYSELPIDDRAKGFKVDAHMTNPVYGVEESDKKSTTFAVYESVLNSPKGSSGQYELAEFGNSIPSLSGEEDLESKAYRASLTNGLYETSKTELSAQSKKEESIYNSLLFEQFVPNNEQRQTLPKDDEDLYGKLLDSQYSVLETSERNYFTEEPIYWQPGSNTTSIYEQLAQKKFREISRKQINVSEQLGIGQFGTVHKGTWNTLRGPMEIAVKTLNGSASPEEKVKFLQEAAINGQFHHPNVIKLCGVVTVGHPIMIVLEYAPHGDLKGFLEKLRPDPGELPDDTLPIRLSNFSLEVASGMRYLAKKKFIHRDLAARNVLVGDGKICKIADFGMSRDLQDETYYMAQGRLIPVKWTAPEAIHFRKYSLQSDVWSFGSVLYEIWSLGHKPFEQHTNQECIRIIDSGKRLSPPPGCPQTVYEIMLHCWHPDANSRPTFDVLHSALEDIESTAHKMDIMAYVGATDDAYSEVQMIYDNTADQ